MVRFTITPWQHHSDLLSVRRQLYQLPTPDTPTPPDERRYAVDRVLAWKMRGGNLPHAVESTALIIDAILHHETSQHQQEQSEHNSLGTAPEISTFSIRAVYTAALTRFITGFCDIGRARAARSTSSSSSTTSLLPPVSMLEIAKQINMPTHFVALRHEATHEEMPALGRLVRVSREGLEWLWGVYWSKLKDENEDVSEEEAEAISKAEVGKLLKMYRTARREEFKQAKKRKKGGVSGEIGGGEANAKVQVLELFARKSGKVVDAAGTIEEVFAETLVEGRLILPSDRQFGTPLDGAYLFWDDLLIALSSVRRSFFQSLLQTLLTAMTSVVAASEIESDPEREAYFLWTLHTITSNAWQEARSRLRLDLRSFMLKQCCLHPGLWSLKLGEEILATAGGDDGLQDLWGPLLAASKLLPNDEGQVDIDRDIPEQQEGNEPATGDTADTSMPDAASSEEDPDELLTGWQRAIFRPKVPIGVVA